MHSIPGQEDPLEKGLATHSRILAWRIPWTEEPGRLQSLGLQSQTWLKWLSTHINSWGEGQPFPPPQVIQFLLNEWKRSPVDPWTIAGVVALTLHAGKSPRVSCGYSSVYTAPLHHRIQPAADGAGLKCALLRKIWVLSGRSKPKPMLFKGQLYYW